MSPSDVEEYVKYPDVPNIFPTADLLPHQVDHVKNMKGMFKENTCGGDTSGTGDGKTHSAAATSDGLPVFVVCPKPVIGAWYNVLADWAVPIVSITNYDMLRSSHSPTTTKWYDMRDGYTETPTICPWITKDKKMVTKANGIREEQTVYRWHLPYKCFIIFDEEHYAKNVHTQNFALVKGAIKAAEAFGHKVLLITASPTEKKENLKTLMYFLGLIKKPNMKLVREFFKTRVGTDSTEAIHNYLYGVPSDSNPNPKRYMCTMPTAQVPPHIKNDINPITYTMDEETTKKIAELNEEIYRERARLKLKQYDNTLGRINANRSFIEWYKKALFADLCTKALTTGVDVIVPTADKTSFTIVNKVFKRVGIFVQFKRNLHELNSRLKESLAGERICTLHGDQSGPESMENITLYNNGGSRVMISTLDKGGVGLSFHPREEDMDTFVIISPPPSATKLIQALGRHFRATVKSSVYQVIVFCEGCKIEASIRKGLDTKIKDGNLLTRGHRGNYDLMALAMIGQVMK
jgi:hypothetical protein